MTAKITNRTSEVLLENLDNANAALRDGAKNFEAYADAVIRKKDIIKQLVKLKIEERAKLSECLNNIAFFGSNAQLAGINKIISSYAVSSESPSLDSEPELSHPRVF
ncbi:hypothetical protein [Legionella sp. km772]|uniref:hypothetical protein n=1 Tax=Legionella sp. km772 TaxID=2498111 RepID=UPI000F8D9D54|nr:hypothetical protein [Legionella sp. km772]RUR08423.1 hypothetical protein ELY15_10875 [Legionella sp. km772]